MAKKVKLTPEELAANILKNRLLDIRNNMYIPKPTLFFKVGEQVKYGATKQSFVEEVLDDGKIYLLDLLCTDNNYGRPIEYKEKQYVVWTELAPYRTIEENNSIQQFSEEDDFRLNFSQRDVSGLLSMYYNFGIDLAPAYQRDFCWELTDKVKLIDSIFQHVDIGKFAVIHKEFEPNTESYEILDGKQRLRTLLDFYENRFQYKGKFYNDLNYYDMNTFEGMPVSIAITQERNMPLEFRYKYFLKLNTSGKPQSEEHMKKVEQLYKEAIIRG